MIKFSRWLDNLYEPGTQFYLRGNNIANPNAGQQLAAWGGDLAGSVIAAPLVASTAAQIGAGLYNAAAPEALDIPGESLANLAALGAMGYGAYRGISRYNRIGGMAGLRERFADRVPINTAAPAVAVAAPVATAAAAAHRPSSDYPYFDPYAGASVAPPLAEPPTGMRFTSPSMGYSEVPGMGATSPRTSIKMSSAYPSLAASLGMGQPVAPPAGVVARAMDVPGPAIQLVPPPANILQDVLTAAPILAPPVSPASAGKSSRGVEPVTVEPQRMREPMEFDPSWTDRVEPAYPDIVINSPDLLEPSDYAGLVRQYESQKGKEVDLYDFIGDEFTRVYGNTSWFNDPDLESRYYSLMKQTADEIKRRTPIDTGKSSLNFL